MDMHIHQFHPAPTLCPHRKDAGGQVRGRIRSSALLPVCTLPEDAGHNKSISISLLSGFHSVVRELGGDPEALLQDAGIDYLSVNRGASVVSGHTLGTLLEKTSEVLSCPDLGLRLATQQSCAMVMKPLDRLLCNAPTIGDILRRCADHRTAFSFGMRLEFDADQALFVERFQILDHFSLFPQLAEQLALLSHHSITYLSGGFARPRMVWFSHLRLSPQASYARRFGAPVKFGQEYDGVFLSDADLKSRVVDSDADVFAAEAREIAARFPTQPLDTVSQVRQLLYRALSSSVCSREEVAETLGLQERTLNRRLRKLGTNFEVVRDEVRRSLALRYLLRGDLSLTDIAGRLGYSELAVLSRSCRRWFGEPPREIQRRLV